MPSIAVFLTQGGLGDCGQHAIAHALKDPELTVHAIAPSRDVIGRIDDENWKPVPFLSEAELQNSRLRSFEVPYTSSDADVSERLREALHGVQAVIAAPTNRQGKGLELGTAAPGMRNILDALKAQSVPRLVYVSSIGIDKPPFQWAWWSGMLGAIAKCFKSWRTALTDLKQADAMVRSSGVDFLIVRPMGLDAKEPVRGSWKVISAQDTTTPLAANIAKADVGQYLLQQVLVGSLQNNDVLLGQPKVSKRNKSKADKR